VKKKRKESSAEGKASLDENFYNLMEIGFNRRASAEHSVMFGKNGDNVPINNILASAALKTVYHMELGKSKEEQLKDLEDYQRSQRKGIVRFLPSRMIKVYDYFRSLIISPKKSDVLRNMALSSFFSFVIWVNARVRSSFMYFVIGNLAIMSFLLTKNMPKTKPMPGMDRKRAITWSSNSFKTAVALTLMSVLFYGSSTLLVTMPFDITKSLKLKLAMIVAIMSTAFTTSCFEVFEDKNKNGWRWEKAINTVSSETKSQLSNSIGTVEMNDKFEFAYDPHVAEFPPKPKYIDEVEGVDPLEKRSDNEHDEKESKLHYETWMADRADARRAPIESAPSDAPWLGSKPGFFSNKVPSWLSKAYVQNVRKANVWRMQKPKFKKDTSEFELVDGPKGFRDKRPEWLNMFGDGIWEEKVTVSRRAARAFGAYRKSMWKVDPKVVLQKCDGADKEIEKKGTKSPKK
jgi:hypothetical protein